MRRGTIARRILVLKPCCFGDLVQMTAVLAAVRQHWPEATLTVGTGAWSLPAVAHHPSIDGTLDLGSAGWRGRRQRQDVLRAWRLLRRGRFDLAVVPDRSPVLCLLTWAAGIPCRAGLDSGGRGRLYTHRVTPLPGVHELDQAARLLVELGIADVPAPRFFPGPEGFAEAARLRRELPATAPLALLAPGGGENPGTSMPDKRWSAAGYAAVAAALVHAGMTVALVGGPTDRHVAGDVAALRPDIHNLCGRTSLDGLGALLTQAQVYVGNDSGTSHLAAAAGCPTLALFGPTEPRLYAPRGSSVRTLAPPAGWRSGGEGNVRRPYRFRRSWQEGVPAAVVIEAALAAAQGQTAAPPSHPTAPDRARGGEG